LSFREYNDLRAYTASHGEDIIADTFIDTAQPGDFSSERGGSVRGGALHDSEFADYMRQTYDPLYGGRGWDAAPANYNLFRSLLTRHPGIHHEL
jgi:hypothetical protein